VRIDPSGTPFILLAAVPTVVLVAVGFPTLAAGFLLLPIALALFFRDPARTPPTAPRLVMAPADGRVMFAGDAGPAGAPAGTWKQVTVFLSIFDVHINRAPVGGTVTRLDYVPGRFLPAFRRDAYQNEHSEIWFDHDGTTIVARQVVGLLARRVVCRLKPGDQVERGGRIGLMKFGSRMDVFVPPTATLTVAAGERVRAGETTIAHLAETST
jgi:phosphatidylserine decarboxylase